MERVKTTKEAIEIAKKHLDKLGISYKIEEITTNEFKSVFVTGIKDDKPIEFSAGKGRDEQYLASGLFELLEHYFLSSSQCNNNVVTCSISNAKLYDKPDYPIAKLKQIDDEIDFLVFNNLYEKGEIYMPAFLVSPEYAKQIVNEKYIRIKQFSTNSGTATGVCFKEALIHAFMEIMERHAISLHYLENYFLKNDSIKLENIIIDNTSLTNKHKKIIEALYKYADSEPVIFDFSKYTEIPTYFVALKNVKINHPFFGAGASFDSDYALERALLECLQCAHGYDEDGFKSDLETIKLFKSFPVLYSIFTMQYKQSKFIKKNYYSKSFEDDVNKIYKEIEIYCQNKNIDIYYRTLYKEEDLCCIQVVMPGTSKLNMIYNGAFIIPTEEEMREWINDKNKSICNK